MAVYWVLFFFFFKQKTAYEMRISDWSSDVCSSDLLSVRCREDGRRHRLFPQQRDGRFHVQARRAERFRARAGQGQSGRAGQATAEFDVTDDRARSRQGEHGDWQSSEEYTSELQSLMRN